MSLESPSPTVSISAHVESADFDSIVSRNDPKQPMGSQPTTLKSQVKFSLTTLKTLPNWREERAKKIVNDEHHRSKSSRVSCRLPNPCDSSASGGPQTCSSTRPWSHREQHSASLGLAIFFFS